MLRRGRLSLDVKVVVPRPFVSDQARLEENWVQHTLERNAPFKFEGDGARGGGTLAIHVTVRLSSRVHC